MIQSPTEPNAPNSPEPLLSPDKDRHPPPLPSHEADGDDDALSESAIPPYVRQQEGS